VKKIKEDLKSPEEKKLIDFVTDENFFKKNLNEGLDTLLSKEGENSFDKQFENIEKSNRINFEF